jgi:hypothetical protein
MSYEELIKIKADLLCEGLKPNEAVNEIKKLQNPFDDPKTGNEGVFIKIDTGTNTINVLVSISHEFDKTSEYEIRKDADNKYKLYKNNQLLDYDISFLTPPEWYNQKTTNDKPMAECFLSEGEHFLHQSYSGCEFHSNGKGCKYCSTKFPRKIATPDEVAETVINVIKNHNVSYV